MNYLIWYQRVVDISHKVMELLSSVDITPASAIVFDIDDTLIQTNGNSIVPILNLYRYAMNIGLNIVIITNRLGDDETIQHTKEQLLSHGITGYKLLYFSPPDSNDNPWRYKELARKNVHDLGMNVIASIGDKPWDIGNFAGIGYLVPVRV